MSSHYPIFSTSFGSVTFTRAQYRIFVSFTLFSKPCSLPFNTTIASNSYISPTFSLENVFLYLFPLFFYYHFLSIMNTGKCPHPPPHPPPPLRFNNRHEQTPAFVWDHCKECGRILTRRLLSSLFVCTIHVNVAMGMLLFNTTHYVMITYVSFKLYSYI